MSEAGADHVERPGPAELRDPLVRHELKRASIWFGLGLAIVGTIFLAQPLLLILGGIVFAACLDGGTRLLGRVLPIGRGWRLLIVTLLAVAFIVGTVWMAGVQLTSQAAALRDTITVQVNRLLQYAASFGLGVESLQPQQLVEQAMSSLGRLTSAVSTVLGGLTSLVMIMVIGLFIAVEPRIYERG
ncbi:MAG: AI-2E family transporter, partial [Allosphingosinicella sp.]